MIVLLVLANVLVRVRVFRWDMTDDKIYSLSEASKELLRQTDAPIEVTLLLDGEMSTGFRRLKTIAEETLEQMDDYAPQGVRIRHLNLNTADKHVRDRYAQRGILPYSQTKTNHSGKTVVTDMYPYAQIGYRGDTAIVPLFTRTAQHSEDEDLGTAIEQIEYAFMENLYLLLPQAHPTAVLLDGHGQKEENTKDLEETLSKYFTVYRGVLDYEGATEDVDVHILDDFDVLLVVNPQTTFSERERFIIDQYIMRGGAALWAVNGVRFDTTLLQSTGKSPILENELGLKEMLFQYGVRINPVLVQDMQCGSKLFNISSDPNIPNLQAFPWTYDPLLLTSYGSPITYNLGQVMSSFVSPIDAVGGEDGIEKRPLLATSTNSRATGVLEEIDMNDINPDPETFRYQYIPTAVSMEGAFKSMYAHRMIPDGVTTDEPIRKQGVQTRQVVIGSGSILSNEVHQRKVFPIGYDWINNRMFSNRDFAVNAALWLANKDGLINLRAKVVPLRLLNCKRAYDERTKIELISTICPVAVLLVIGGCVFVIRRKRYASKKV